MRELLKNKEEIEAKEIYKAIMKKWIKQGCSEKEASEKLKQFCVR